VIEIEARLSELEDLRLRRRMRLVSGPQGPRVVLDGKPTLVLCSGNYLGLADHPRVREAAAEAALRWGAGAGASRLTSGTMTIHRRLEEHLAEFLGQEVGLVFGSGYLAGLGVLSALARPGEVVFADAHNQASLADGCRLSGAEVFTYEHLDLDHLRWGIARAEGRGSVIVTESVFGLDGDLAPLGELARVARRRHLRLVVDEGHAIGALGPGGRGAVADAGLTDEVDVILGTLGHSLASYGGFVACRRRLADYLLNASRTLSGSTACAPAAAAGALAALEQLAHRPQLVARLSGNARVLRAQLERRGLRFDQPPSQILSILVADPAAATSIFESALRGRVLVEPVRPPAVADVASRIRLTVMASHHPQELMEAADVVARSIHAAGLQPAEPALPASPGEPAAATERAGRASAAPRAGRASAAPRAGRASAAPRAGRASAAPREERAAATEPPRRTAAAARARRMSAAARELDRRACERATELRFALSAGCRPPYLRPRGRGAAGRLSAGGRAPPIPRRA